MTESRSSVPPLPLHPHAGVAMHSRRPVARRRFNLSIDTTDHRHRRVEPPNEVDTASTSQFVAWKARLDIQLALFQAKTLLDSAPISLHKYDNIDRIARQAHAQALAIQDADLTARCCFYLGECEIVLLNDGERHVIRANELYTRCTLCSDESAIEPALARKRLDELSRMFPTSALSVASNIAPWSALPASGTRRTSHPNTAENLLQRAVVHAQKRNYTRVPSFDSAASGMSSPAQSIEEPARPGSKVSPPLPVQHAPSPVLQMMLGAYKADYNTLSPLCSPPRLLKSVAFTEETCDGSESGKEISQRRKLSRTLTTPHIEDANEQHFQAGIPLDVVDSSIDMDS